MAIIIGIKYNHIEREGALTFRVNFVFIRGKKKERCKLQRSFLLSYSLVDLLSLFRKADSSCLSDDSDFDLTWVSHLCLDLFREVE